MREHFADDAARPRRERVGTPEDEVEASAGDAAPIATRRAVALVALAAVLLFGAVAGALAVRQYRDAEHSAANDSRARAVLAAGIFDIYFKGQIGALSSLAQAPVVQSTDEAGMLDYFSRVQPPGARCSPAASPGATSAASSA